MTLLGYNAILNYSLSQLYMDESYGDEKVKITMSAKYLSIPAPTALFDDERLIQWSGKKATLKRYRNYQTIIPNSKN